MVPYPVNWEKRKAMEVSKFLEKKETEIDGTMFLLSKMPAIQGQQAYGAVMRETKEDGDLAMTYLSTETGLKLLEYTAYKDGDTWYPLETEEMVNTACESILKLQKLEAAMIRYNFGFLFDGSLQNLLEEFKRAENPDT